MNIPVRCTFGCLCIWDFYKYCAAPPLVVRAQGNYECNTSI